MSHPPASFNAKANSQRKTIEDILHWYIEESNIMEKLTEESYGRPDSNGMYEAFSQHRILDSSFQQPLKNTYISISTMINFMVENKLVIWVENKEVGALFHKRMYSQFFIPVALLKKIAENNILKPAQMHELERLLNKADETLGVDLPTLPVADDNELQKALMEMSRDIILAKPRAYRQKFLDQLTLNGSPTKMNEAEFKAAVERLMTP